MAFKLIPPFDKYPTPVVNMPLEKGVLGRADKRGNILINKDIIAPEQVQNTVNHEEVHIKQMACGDLDYDEKAVYWKGKKYLRSKLDESNKKLPWEKDAYKAG